jgi:Flp pilus assembly protein TadG
MSDHNQLRSMTEHGVLGDVSMMKQCKELAGMAKRLAGCTRGAATIEFTLIAVAMLIGIAVAVGDIGTSLMAGGELTASKL